MNIKALIRFAVVAASALLAFPGCTGNINNDTITIPLTSRVSVGSNFEQADGNSFRFSITPDGRYLAFATDAGSLDGADFNGQFDIYIRDLVLGTTVRISLDADPLDPDFDGDNANGPSFNPSISSNGQFVAFQSFADDLILPAEADPFADIYVRDLVTGITERISVDPGGLPANDSSGDTGGASKALQISGNGQFVVFQSHATNLVADLDDNAANLDVFVRDLALDTTTIISVRGDGATQPSRASHDPSISDDGRWMSFTVDGSGAGPFDPTDLNSADDVYLRDRLDLGADPLRISREIGFDKEGDADDNSDGSSLSSWVSGNGAFVAFVSFATDLITDDFNFAGDIFRYNRVTPGISRVSLSSNGGEGLDMSSQPFISQTGRYVAFVSNAPNFVDGDTNAGEDIFVRDLTLGVTLRVNLKTFGGQSAAAGQVPTPHITADGAFAFFVSGASNLISNDTNASADIYRRGQLVYQ